MICHASPITPNRKVLPTLLSSKKKKTSLCPRPAQPIIDCSSPTNEKPPYFELPASSNRLLGYNSPSKSPSPFPIKAISRSLFFGFAYGLPWFAYPKLQFLWLFPKKLVFACKITDYYYIIKVVNSSVTYYTPARC